ncbi:ABC transporter permease subunit [Herpetosiphon llansteffanensis]|uniref:ABC transporter permease subunit n=1 Tax=Herpetosiphon llansteffanensis TaxID=2094568 RepID=UPI000D7C545F|nr:ABC transporter permease subunit [Herpetosiphon llansteffanensis]
MSRLVLRKLALLIVLVPALHLFGAWYAYKYTGYFYPPKPIVIMTENGRTDGVQYDRQPFMTRYRETISAMAKGDLGRINKDRTKVNEYIDDFIIRSAKLLGVAFLTTIILGLGMCLLAISPRTGRISPVMVSVFTLGNAIPGFFLGSLLVLALLYVKRVGWTNQLLLPVQGYTTSKHLILPALILALRPAFYIASIGAGLLENELQQDYVRFAKSKGLRWTTIVRRHAIPNVAPAVFASLGRGLQMAVGSLVLVESLFDWRGIGWMLFNSLTNTKAITSFHPLILGLLLAMLGAVLIVVDLVASVLSLWINPLGRHTSAGRG